MTTSKSAKRSELLAEIRSLERKYMKKVPKAVRKAEKKIFRDIKKEIRATPKDTTVKVAPIKEILKEDFADVIAKGGAIPEHIVAERLAKREREEQALPLEEDLNSEQTQAMVEGIRQGKHGKPMYDRVAHAWAAEKRAARSAWEHTPEGKWWMGNRNNAITMKIKDYNNEVNFKGHMKDVWEKGRQEFMAQVAKNKAEAAAQKPALAMA